MNTHNKTFCNENKCSKSALTAIPARDIIIANTKRVDCPGCGFLIGRVIPGENPSGALYYCRRCRSYNLVKVDNPTVP